MRYLSVRNMLLVAVLAAVAFPAASEAGWFFRWWQRPPAEELPDLEFPEVDATRAKLYCFVVSNRRLQSRQRIELQGAATAATLIGGELSIDSVALEDTDTLVDVSLNPTSVKANYFGSSFHGDGTATISQSGEETQIDVKSYGSIKQRDGEYSLRACVVGYARTDDGEGTKKIFLLSFKLSGAGTPVEDGGTTEM